MPFSCTHLSLCILWQYRLWSFQARVQNQKDFCIRIKISIGNYWILSFRLMASCQKWGIILVINWLYQKMSITKNVLLNWYSPMKKKIEKDSDDCWHRKLTLKVKLWYFLTAPHYSNFQNLVISFEYSWFLAKNLSNFVSLPWKLHNRECHSVHTA